VEIEIIMKIKLTICLLAFLNFYEAQENITYQKPSPEILKLADYERPPSVLMNSKKDWIVFTYRPTYKTLGRFKSAGNETGRIKNKSGNQYFKFSNVCQ
jgi:hypothetical protein